MCHVFSFSLGHSGHSLLKSSVSSKHVFLAVSYFGTRKQKSFETWAFQFNFPHPTQTEFKFPTSWKALSVKFPLGPGIEDSLAGGWGCWSFHLIGALFKLPVWHLHSKMNIGKSAFAFFIWYYSPITCLSFMVRVLTTSPRQFWKTTGRLWIRVSYLGHLMIDISLNGKET